jgi:S-adenosylmethionine/arginine decarboxylase-like enzyme
MSYRHGRKVSGTFRAQGSKLADVGLISQFMAHTVKAIDMTALGTHIYDVPLCVKRLGQDPLTDEGGVTALVCLSTSHFALHTWPEEQGARIDIDSCRDFAPEIIAQLLRLFFEAEAIELHDLSFCFGSAGVGHEIAAHEDLQVEQLA